MPATRLRLAAERCNLMFHCCCILQAIAKALEEGGAPQLIVLNLRDNPLGPEATQLVVSHALMSKASSDALINEQCSPSGLPPCKTCRQSYCS